MNDDRDLDAGEFSSWFVEMKDALDGRGESDVPCNGCTACCRSSQFVHIEPDEVDTLDHIPAELLFPAPGLPEGHVVLGYDEHGECPMLGDNGCSIYAHRPRACRVYDCRVFAATGVEIDEPSKGDVARRARRWRFSFASAGAQVHCDAVRAAAAYLDAHHEELPGDGRPLSATHRAVLSVEIADVFLGSEPVTGAGRVVEPAPGAVAAALDGRRRDGSGAGAIEREPELDDGRTEG
jgi:Fe-S-cluster containining protein